MLRKGGGANGDGPVNHTESDGVSGTGQMGLDMDTCKICDEEVDGECQGGLCAHRLWRVNQGYRAFPVL